MTVRETIGTDTVLAVVGPTASGKSELAVDIARVVGGEIVSIDAVQVYAELAAGSARPAPALLETVPHHLVGTLSVQSPENAAQLRDRARAVIDGLLDRGCPPVLVGGAGLHFRSVVDDLPLGPTDPAVRAALEARAAAGDDLAGELTSLEPGVATLVDLENPRRVIRALEIRQLTGRAYADFRDDEAWRGYRPHYAVRAVMPVFPPHALKARIAARTAALVEPLLREVAALRPELVGAPAEAIGYRQARAALDAAGGDAARIDRGSLAAAITARTWQYARRQTRWFGKDPRVHPVPGDNPLPAALERLFDRSTPTAAEAQTCTS